MAEATQGGAASTAAPAIDHEALAKAMAPLIGAAVAEAVKPLNERIEKLQAPAPAAETKTAAGKENAPKPLSLEDITKLLDERDGRNRSAQQREQFQQSKLADLPAAYRHQLGTDPAKWAAEEQTIRAQYREDLAKAGVKAANVGGTSPGGAKPADAPPADLSKMNGTQKILLGLKNSHPARATTSGTVAGHAAAQTGAVATTA